MADTVRNVYYGCNNCGKEFAVATEADIPLGHLCSTKCRKEWLDLQDKLDNEGGENEA